MGKEKKKSDWENLSEMLDAPQNVDDWSADEPSTAPVAEAEVEVEKSAAKTTAKKRVCGEKKAKATKTRKKAAPKTDKIDAALATPLADAPQDAETLDLTVAETEKAPKKRRRTTKKVEQDETELVKNVLKLANETKAKKRARAKAAEANPFVGLISQIERVAQEEAVDETPESEAVEAVAPEELEAVVEAPETETEVVEASEENVESNDFFDADFFADSNVEELEISWGRPRADEPETEVESPVAEPEAEAEEETADVPVEPAAEATAPRRRERRRRRRDDRAPREETNVAETVSAVDLNDLDAFFATDSEDEGVGFAPRRESKKEEKIAKEEKAERAEAPERPAFCVDASNDEDDEAPSKRKRRRRRNGRRSFEDDAEAPTFDAESVENEPEIVDESEAEPETFETERAPRDRRRRERRPRRERETDVEPVENDAVESTDERRAGAPERVLPSWSDAISHVVRFNMSRRVNRRR